MRQTVSVAVTTCVLLLAMMDLAAERLAESLIYGDVRVAVELNDLEEESSGLRNYASRIGFRHLEPLGGENERTRGVFHAEIGFKEDSPGFHGTRVLLIGVKGSAGQLSFGKQWSAFYTTIGSFMDAGFVQSGLGYPGSERISESVQYSKLFNQTYVQLDAVRDDVKGGGGFNRYQAGLSYEGIQWRGGVALDFPRRRDSAKRELSAGVERKSALCDRRAVRCVGATGGWAADGLAIDLGVVRSTQGSDRATGAGLTVRWEPNQYSYYLETSAVNQPDARIRALAVGMRYRLTPHWSAFLEGSRTRNRYHAGTTTDHTLALGLQFEFEEFGPFRTPAR